MRSGCRGAGLLLVLLLPAAVVLPRAAARGLRLAERLGREGVDGWVGLPFDQALLGLLTVVFGLAWCWLLLATALVVVRGTAGRLGRVPGCPDSWRRVVLAACGLAVAGGVAAGPAVADPAGSLPAPTPAAAPASGLAAALSGLVLPDRVPGGLAGDSDLQPAETVTVRPGDTLWAIASRHLPGRPSPAAIAAAWPRWYRANQDRLGADPDLIHPGTVLRAPGEPAAVGCATGSPAPDRTSREEVR